jgi:hypothetical protein
MWLRNNTTGERGTLVEHDGKQYVKLDRNAQEILLPYIHSTKVQWEEDSSRAVITDMQAARVAHAADVAFCAVHGRYGHKAKQWESMSDAEKISWSKDGPLADKDTRRPDLADKRRSLWSAVLAAIK